MPTPCHRYALFLAAFTLLSWPSPAPCAQPPAASNPDTEQTYTVQHGDTLSRIAHKFGLSAEAIIRANDLKTPDRLGTGFVLRLPVTPPGVAPESAKAAPAATPQPTVTAAQAPAADRGAPVQPPAPPATPPVATAPAQTPAKPAVPTPQTPAEATAAAPAATATPIGATAAAQRNADINRQAVGLYKHPGLGMLRISQSAEGLVLSKDNMNIPMRHLLYGLYDGTDTSGSVHNILLDFDANGHVTALRYSLAGTGQVTFEKVKK